MIRSENKINIEACRQNTAVLIHDSAIVCPLVQWFSTNTSTYSLPTFQMLFSSILTGWSGFLSEETQHGSTWGYNLLHCVPHWWLLSWGTCNYPESMDSWWIQTKTLTHYKKMCFSAVKVKFIEPGKCTTLHLLTGVKSFGPAVTLIPVTWDWKYVWMKFQENITITPFRASEIY